MAKLTAANKTVEIRSGDVVETEKGFIGVVTYFMRLDGNGNLYSVESLDGTYKSISVRDFEIVNVWEYNDFSDIEDEPIAAPAAPVSAEFAAAVENAAAEYAPVLDALAASEPTPFAVGDFVYIVLASGVIMRDVVIAMNDKDLETSYSYIIPFERCFDTYPQAHEYRNSVMSAVAPKTNGTVADSLYDKLEAIAQGNVGDRTPSGIASEAIAELNALRAENDALRAQLAAARQAFEKIYTYYDEENFAKRVAYVALDSLNK